MARLRFLVFVPLVFLFFGCGDGLIIGVPAVEETIVYRKVDWEVRQGEPFPIAVDVTEDGLLDFTIFLELTADSVGDHLYAGINPLGPNLVMSGPPDNEHLHNMGFAVSQDFGVVIDERLEENQIWTSDHAALVIRNTFSNGDISYEGKWDGSPQIAGIQIAINGSTHFGWLRINFDKTTEVVTLIDYAYDLAPNCHILAGQGASDL